MSSYCVNVPSKQKLFDPESITMILGTGEILTLACHAPSPPHPFDSSLIVCYSPRELGQVQNESEPS